MSKISDIVTKHIIDYDRAKTGDWRNLKSPPENTFTKDELFIIGRGIISELEGYLSDMVLQGRFINKP